MLAGDVIVGVNGTDVKGEDSARRVIKLMRDVKPDSKVTVRVLRGAKTQDFTIVARGGPHGPQVMGFAAGPDVAINPFMAPPLPLKPLFMAEGPLANMEFATLTPQLGRYFGTAKGVLVVRAPADGALKLEDGDVILTIDGREPTSGSHATRILGSYQPGEKIALRIMREHKTMELESTLPEPPGPGAIRKGSVFLETEPGIRKQVVIRSERETT
jgi:S1-C subfamily serine protease